MPSSVRGPRASESLCRGFLCLERGHIEPRGRRPAHDIGRCAHRAAHEPARLLRSQVIGGREPALKDVAVFAMEVNYQHVNRSGASPTSQGHA